jgi:predicted ester cyclase
MSEGVAREEANKAVVRAVAEAIDRQDLAALHNHPGLNETVESIPVMWAAFPDMRTTIDHMFADGDMVAACATVRGTHRGAFMGIQPTGQEVSFTALTLDRVVDGRIVLH